MSEMIIIIGGVFRNNRLEKQGLLVLCIRLTLFKSVQVNMMSYGSVPVEG
jgi:hypothetical protein